METTRYILIMYLEGNFDLTFLQVSPEPTPDLTHILSSMLVALTTPVSY